MSQLIKIENQGLVVAQQQFDLLRQLTYGATRERILRIVEKNEPFFQTMLSIHFPFEGAWIDEVLPKIKLGSTHYSQFDKSTGKIEYAKLGLTFNQSVSFPDLLDRSIILNSLLIENNGSTQLPLDLGLEREYKLQANRDFAFRNQLSRETTNRYFDFEEEIMKMKSGRNGYSLSQLETLDYKYLMLYDNRFYLNFKPYMTKDFVICFFKNLT